MQVFALWNAALLLGFLLAWLARLQDLVTLQPCADRGPHCQCQWHWQCHWHGPSSLRCIAPDLPEESPKCRKTRSFERPQRKGPCVPTSSSNLAFLVVPQDRRDSWPGLLQYEPRFVSTGLLQYWQGLPTLQFNVVNDNFNNIHKLIWFRTDMHSILDAFADFEFAFFEIQFLRLGAPCPRSLHC